MRDARFSPATWHTRNEVIYESSNRRVARVEKHYWPDDEKKANARLIACAPELYAMISEYTTLLRGKGFTEKLTAYEKNFIDDGKRLLAKARGEHEH